MGEAKLKKRSAFAAEMVELWERDQCVDFAVALARATGWLLHVDWWVPSMNQAADVPMSEFKPLRVYVADNGDRVFDVRGVRSIHDFNDRTIRPLAEAYGNGSVRTRYYAEAKLAGLPLKRQPDEQRVMEAIRLIEANPLYLGAVGVRRADAMPAHHAAAFSYGQCVPFAEALAEQTGLPAVALIALRKSAKQQTKTGSSGFFHSVVMHRNGMVEDAWGIAPLREVANRFGIIECTTSADEHHRVAETLRTNSGDRYQLSLEKARQLIMQHRLTDAS